MRERKNKKINKLRYILPKTSAANLNSSEL